MDVGITGDAGLPGTVVAIGVVDAVGSTRNGAEVKGVEGGFTPTTGGFAGTIEGGGGAAVGMVGLGSGKSGIYHSIIA